MQYRVREHSELKPSGIEWLGDIPKDWELIPLGRLDNFSSSGINKLINKDESSVKIINFTDIYSNKKHILNSSINYMKVTTPEENRLKNLVNKGDLIFLPSSETFEDLGLSALVDENLENTAFSYHVIRFQFKKDIDYAFRKYLTNNNYILNMFSSFGNGTTRKTINRDVFKKLKVILLKLIEQHKIANFLDKKIKTFDDILSKKETLIKKLEDAKQSLISEVVSGKLKVIAKDGKLQTIRREEKELKSSGVEWLGDIPKEWELKKLKYISKILSSNVDKKSYDDEIKVLLCNYMDVYKNDYITNDINFTKATATKSEIKKFLLIQEDILITKDSESPNDIAVPTYVKEKFENVLCGYHLAIIRNTKNEIFSKYLFRFFELRGVENYFETMAKGVTRYGLSIDAFRNIFVPSFSIDEQKQISEYLDFKIEVFNKTIEKTKQSIIKLKLAKESLISEAVTGKIEIIEENAKASSYFQRRVLAAYFIDNSLDDEYFGRVKLQKMLYMAEAVNDLDFNSDYKRHAMGPYDPKLMKSIESQLKKAKWFGSKKVNDFGKIEYFALDKKDDYKKYLDGRYFKQENIEYIYNLMKGMKTLQTEIIATVYSAYKDLKEENRVSKDNLLDEILNKWHDNKKKVSQEKWEVAINWLNEKRLINI